MDIDINIDIVFDTNDIDYSIYIYTHYISYIRTLREIQTNLDRNKIQFENQQKLWTVCVKGFVSMVCFTWLRHVSDGQDLMFDLRT